MRYAYFLIAENMSNADRADLDAELLNEHRSAERPDLSALGGEVRSGRRTK